jgi:hypothetical protein
MIELAAPYVQPMYCSKILRDNLCICTSNAFAFIYLQLTSVMDMDSWLVFCYHVCSCRHAVVLVWGTENNSQINANPYLAD